MALRNSVEGVVKGSFETGAIIKKATGCAGGALLEVVIALGIVRNVDDC